MAARLLSLEAMRLAVPIWGDRVSPLFDVARRLLLVEVDRGQVISTMEHDVAATDRVRSTTQLGVDLLICGAVSRELEQKLVSAGVEVIGDICGAVEEVVDAFLADALGQERFTMPGCTRRWSGRHRPHRPRRPAVVPRGVGPG
jgi:predicted Fe-Mo cluster-binding NifX family protein